MSIYNKVKKFIKDYLCFKIYRDCGVDNNTSFDATFGYDDTDKLEKKEKY